MDLFRNIFCAIALVAVFPAIAAGNEIDGFRLGMTTEQAMKLAAQRGYSFGKVIPGDITNWTSYILSNDGPSISFCGNVLSSMTKTADSNLHEFTHVLERWTKSLGVPDGTNASQTYAQERPVQLFGLQVGAGKRAAISELFSARYGQSSDVIWLQLHQSSLPSVYSMSKSST
jgi:hypothetical protein